MGARLQSYLVDAARRRAFREALSGQSMMSGPAPTGQMPGGVGSQRAGNQRGGMTQGGQPPMRQPMMMPTQEGQGGGLNFGTLLSGGLGFLTGGPIGAGAAILASIAGSSRSGGGAQGQQAQSTPSNRDAYNTAQGQALQGQLPPAMMQGALSQGMGLMNQQAQNSQQNVGANMAARGLTQSGVAANAYGEIEQTRLQGLAGLSQRLAEMAYSGQQSAMGREASAQGQQRAIDAAQPEWWETLAQAAGPISQFVYQQQHPATDPIAALAQVLGMGSPEAGDRPPSRPYLQPNSPVME